MPWYATKIFEDLGFSDSFREKNPNPLKKPGITWDNKTRNDSHRIDYIFYKGGGIKAIESESFMAFFNEPLKINDKEILYPSDHGIVVTKFKLNNYFKGPKF